MQFPRRTPATLLTTGVIVVALAGCGSTDTAAPTEASGAPLTEEQLNGLEVTFVPGVTADSFYISMQCGMQEVADEYGITIANQDPAQYDVTVQTPIVNAVAQTQTSALLVAPTDPVALTPALQKVADAGIPIGLVDSTIEDTSLAFTEVRTDNEAAGATAADALAELIGGSGKVLAIAFKTGAGPSDERQRGFEERITSEHPDIELLESQDSNNDPAKAASIVSAALAANPDLKGIFATNQFAAQGASTGIRNAGKEGDVKVVGFDAGPTQVEQLERGDVQALVAQQPKAIGEQVIEQLVGQLTGGEVESSILVGAEVVTAENLDEMGDVLYKESCD